MSAHDDRLEAIYMAALKLEPGQRGEYVRQACGDDQVLQAEVQSLLAHEEQLGSFLEKPAEAKTTALTGAAGARQSMELGRYHLLQKIGEGGMGEVWLAEQREPVRRRVALKLVKAGMDTREVIARFESERQALALMDHPAIAKIFDAGATPAGAPYFVMEYVAGVPITTYCDKHRLTTRKRLELFMRVCEGVQHAHQRAIIHRDLKPSNILVTEIDGHPAPKIIDFGVAKALSQRLTADTLFTRVGALVGTPEYMSPEQANSSGEDIDTRTDIYSLGIIFYELLAGAQPLHLRKIAFDEFLRRLREEDAPKPSTKIRTQDPVTSQEVARNRQTEPAELAKQLRGDLDAIALKALEKDRSRRYGSPADLAADVGRYLQHQAVLAVPPSAAYRTRKFAQRHRRALISAGAGIVATVVIATAFGAVASLLRDRARHRSDLERIRWTLQQVIDNPKRSPEAEQPEWPRLLNVLHQEVRRNPSGGLALLAQQAGCRVFAVASSFGLVSNPSELDVFLNRGVDPGTEFVNIVYVEGSLDDGPWRPILSATCNQQASLAFGNPLDRFFPAASLTPVPHDIKLRATFRLFDPKMFDPELRAEFVSRTSVFGPPEQAWPAMAKVVPLLVKTRMLETVQTTLYTQYPPDFPRRAAATGAPQSWSHLERVRIIRVRLPPGAAPAYAFQWPKDNKKTIYCLPANSTNLVNAIVGIEFLGRLDPPVWLAADATVWSDSNSRPLISLPLVWQQGKLASASKAAGSVHSSSNDTGWAYSMANFAALKHGKLPTLPGSIPDGITAGRIDFSPSRKMALEFNLDRYFGEKFSIPIPALEILTVPGEWVQKGDCR